MDSEEVKYLIELTEAQLQYLKDTHYRYCGYKIATLKSELARHYKQLDKKTLDQKDAYRAKYITPKEKALEEMERRKIEGIRSMFEIKDIETGEVIN